VKKKRVATAFRRIRLKRERAPLLDGCRNNPKHRTEAVECNKPFFVFRTPEAPYRPHYSAPQNNDVGGTSPIRLHFVSCSQKNASGKAPLSDERMKEKYKDTSSSAKSHFSFVRQKDRKRTGVRPSDERESDWRLLASHVIICHFDSQLSLKQSTKRSLCSTLS